MPRRITSLRQAAQVAGRSAPTIAGWVTSGRLPQGPWTERQLLKASATSSSPGIASEHGTADRWRLGCTCDACRDAHLDQVRDMRRGRAIFRIDWVRDQILDILASGGTFADVHAQTGLTSQALHGAARTDADWRAALDEALMVGRDPDLAHGTPSGWRRGCRCPECRAEHAHSQH